MTRIDELMKTNELQELVDELLKKLDAANMQIIGVADLAKQALENELEGAANCSVYALDAIRSIAATANANLDDAQIALSDARLASAGRVSTESPFGRVAPL